MVHIFLSAWKSPLFVSPGIVKVHCSSPGLMPSTCKAVRRRIKQSHRGLSHVSGYPPKPSRWPFPTDPDSTTIHWAAKPTREPPKASWVRGCNRSWWLSRYLETRQFSPSWVSQHFQVDRGHAWSSCHSVQKLKGSNSLELPSGSPFNIPAVKFLRSTTTVAVTSEWMSPGRSSLLSMMPGPTFCLSRAC